MNYIYPAIFTLNNDGSYTITFPDLPGCITEGKSLANALYMAQNALTQWIEFLLDEKETIANPSQPKAIKTTQNQFVNLVAANIRDNRAVRRTVSIPSWLDTEAADAGLSLSKILQEALKERLS